MYHSIQRTCEAGGDLGKGADQLWQAGLESWSPSKDRLGRHEVGVDRTATLVQRWCYLERTVLEVLKVGGIVVVVVRR